jgi:hypothetical protein
MRRLWIGGIIIAIVGYLSFMIATLPAEWLLSRAQLPQGISYSKVSGTLWEGQAKIIAQNPSAQNQSNSTGVHFWLFWKTDFWMLFKGVWQADVELDLNPLALGQKDSSISENSRLFAKLSYSPAELKLDQLRGQIDAKYLNFWLDGFPMLSQVEINGTILLDSGVASWQIVDNLLNAMVMDIVWKDASISWWYLGAYRHDQFEALKLQARREVSKPLFVDVLSLRDNSILANFKYDHQGQVVLRLYESLLPLVGQGQTQNPKQVLMELSDRWPVILLN